MATRRFLKICLVGTALIAGPLAYAAEKNDTLQWLDLFGEVFERVRADYVEPVKDSDLIEAALNGMLTSLDPHSGYMNEKAFQEMQVQTKGEFGGLGIEVTMDNGLVKVISPIDDTPAAKAGIKPGDYISYIDDQPVLGLTLSDAVDKMRGPIGSKVKLTVLREGEKEPLDLTLTRAEIKIKSVRERAIDDDIAYIRITSFTEQTTDLMRSEFDRIKKKLPHLHGIVLDLRNNPGGLLDQAISVSDAFLKDGEIVSTRERDPEKTKRYSAHPGDELVPDSIPVAVLINSGTASASEIVSGALQDHKRAVIMGTQSFGKGSVQTVIPLTGHGAIRLTTARYYTPSGRSIQAKGITPDITVEQAKIEPIKRNEHMLTEATLRHSLKNLQEERARAKKAAESKAGKASTGDESESEEKALFPGEMPEAQDFQLQRAIDLLRAVSIYGQATQDK